VPKLNSGVGSAKFRNCQEDIEIIIICQFELEMCHLCTEIRCQNSFRVNSISAAGTSKRHLHHHESAKETKESKW
jgi:hypothetical protein